MFSLKGAAALLLQATIGLSTPLASRQSSNGTFQNGVYFTNWAVSEDFLPSNLPASSINNVFYAFLDVKPDGTVTSSDPSMDLETTFPGDDPSEAGNNVYGAVKQLGLLKRDNRHIKVVMSVGGGGRSENFTTASATQETRSQFAQSAVGLMKDWGFDGIDVDWEYPTTREEADNYISLLRAVRDEMDAYSEQQSAAAGGGYHFLLTSAVSGLPEVTDLVDSSALGSVLDWVNIMAYDYSGTWTPDASAHQANLHRSSSKPDATPFSSQDAVEAYIDGGCPARKLVLGIPTYSRQFVGTTGIGEPWDGVGTGSAGEGSWLYRDLPQDGAQEIFDEEAGASYSWSEANGGIVNSYDTVEAVQAKVSFLTDMAMGGSFFWEASGDREGEGSLMETSFQALGGAATLDMRQNLVDYPESVYDNVRNGFA